LGGGRGRRLVVFVLENGGFLDLVLLLLWLLFAHNGLLVLSFHDSRCLELRVVQLSLLEGVHQPNSRELTISNSVLDIVI
jgi:hypothetical protein